MKIKIALFGLFLANSMTHLHADQYNRYKEDPEECEIDNKKDDARERDKAKSEDLIKLSAALGINPAFTLQDKEYSHKNRIAAELKFSADVPKVWCNKDATININSKWDGKDFAIKKAVLSIGKMVTMGHDATIFGYEKADAASLVSVDATVLQTKFAYEFDCFRMAMAFERPVELQVGCFDKDYSEEKSDTNTDKKEENRTNKVDKSDQKNLSFKIKNSLPTLGINIGVVTDDCNIGLSALGRLIDYTHSAKSDEKNYYLTYGANLGIQYEIVPKKVTATGQGIYVHGLGDYIGGLAAVQSDKKREEMCAVYYCDKDKDSLSAIDAWGASFSVKYSATPKWTLSISGSYLSALEDDKKPAQAFNYQYNAVPKIAYEVSKYITLSAGYTLAKEWRVNKEKDKGHQHKLSAGIKFSLK